MTGSPTEQASHVFGCLHGMVRTAALYPPMHAQTVKAKQTLHDALTAYLRSHGRLVYRFLRDALRDIQPTARARSPLAVEQIGTLRVFTSTLLEQILQSPALVLRLASIKSYDEYTLYHSVNVAVISIGLGLVIGLPETLLREIAMAGMLHDVGKIAIPHEILRKPGPLDEEEWQVMRRHPVLGADVLSRLPGSTRLPIMVAS